MRVQEQNSTTGSPLSDFRRHLAAILWLALALSMPRLQPALAGEPRYEVRGFMQQTDSGGKTNPFCDFWVAVSGQRSLIKVVYFNGESFACGTDGIDTYLLNEMLPATRQHGAGTIQFADISAGPFPRLALSPVQMAWLAFASGGSLRKHGNELPMEFLQENAAVARNEVVLSTSPPLLPRSLKWWGPNFRVVGSQKHPLLAYPEGYLAAMYSIGPTTNFGGNELPLQWTLAFYLPDSHQQNQTARKEDVALFGTLVATVTNVSPLAYRGDFLPPLGTQPVQFMEHRLQQRAGLAQQYSIINGVPLTHWPGREDPRFKQLARNASPRWRLWWSLTGRNYAWGLIAMGVTAVLATFFAIFWWGSNEETLP